ncbi:hypothetical protein LVJ94_40625 [Pendulispora rubella]|uniref:Uncharacterized protein n=1 Tax=Pendulispora rubella TaxID=2741070 RepID=A0ABZ2KX60_9BACT
MLPFPVQSLLEIFNNELADLRFGDMDAKGLADLAAEVEAASHNVVTAQAAVDAAKAKLTERQEAMITQAQRALAYARIYAESNEPLRARLDAISLPKLAKRAAPKGDEAPASAEGAPKAEGEGEATKPRRGRPAKNRLASEAGGKAETAAAAADAAEEPAANAAE